MCDSFEDEQRELSQLWKKARKDGCMSPWQQAKAYGLKEAWEEMHGDRVYALWIAMQAITSLAIGKLELAILRICITTTWTWPLPSFSALGLLAPC